MKRLYWRFYKAARRRDVDTVVDLLRSYPELHGYEGQAGTVLEVLDREAPELLEAAFQAGLSPNAEPDNPCQTLLQSAAANGDLDRLRLLIRYGVDLDRRNHAGQLEAVRELVEAGAEVNTIEEDPRTGYRNTPLDCAHQYPEIVEYLQSRGAKHLDELEAPGVEWSRRDAEGLGPSAAD